MPAMMCLRLVPASFGPLPIGKRTFVATTSRHALPCQPPPDDFLRRAPPVDIGGVNKGPARRNELVEHRVARRFVRLTPEGHRAQAQFAHAQARFAQKSVLHHSSRPFFGSFRVANRIYSPLPLMHTIIARARA